MSSFSHTGIARRVAEYKAADYLDAESILDHLRLDLQTWDLDGLKAEENHIIDGLISLGERGLATAEYLRDTATGVRRLLWIEIHSVLVQLCVTTPVLVGV